MNLACYKYLLLGLVALSMGLSSCTSFLKEAEQVDEFTRIYPAKSGEQINYHLTLYRKLNKKTGEREGEGHFFTALDKSRVQAEFGLDERLLDQGRTLLFHFDWIGPDGKTFYIKGMELSAADSVKSASSSISLSPEVRDTGRYTLHVYLFRERILEKEFSVLPAFQNDAIHPEKYIERVTLYRKKGKKTGRLIGVDSVFTRKSKRNVRVQVDLVHNTSEEKRERLYEIEWIGPDGKSFYKKKINLQAGDTASTVNSSISIDPRKREAGVYDLNIYLYNRLLKNKAFILE